MYKYIPLGLFSAFCIKYLIFSVSYAEIAIFAISAGTVCFFEHFSNKESLKSIDTKYDKRFTELAAKAKEIDEVKNGLVGLKLGQNFRSTNKIG